MAPGTPTPTPTSLRSRSVVFARSPVDDFEQGVDGCSGPMPVRRRLNDFENVAGAGDETAGNGRRADVDRHRRDVPIQADRFRDDCSSSSLE